MTLHAVCKLYLPRSSNLTCRWPLLAPPLLPVIPDIECVNTANGKKYVFSDGVGTISPKLAKILSDSLEMNFVPSAFQIRFSGAKGVVTVDPRLEGELLCLRKSQLKFACKHGRLEVIRPSFASPLFLNRQVITLLEALGVGYEAFERLQNEMLKQLDDVARAISGDASPEVLSDVIDLLLAR